MTAFACNARDKFQICSSVTMSRFRSCKQRFTQTVVRKDSTKVQCEAEAVLSLKTLCSLIIIYVTIPEGSQLCLRLADVDVKRPTKDCANVGAFLRDHPYPCRARVSANASLCIEAFKTSSSCH